MQRCEQLDLGIDGPQMPMRLHLHGDGCSQPEALTVRMQPRRPCRYDTSTKGKVEPFDQASSLRQGACPRDWAAHVVRSVGDINHSLLLILMLARREKEKNA